MALSHRFIVPYLMGQRRDGLGRVAQLSPHTWEIVRRPDCAETKVEDPIQRLRLMGQIYSVLANRVSIVAREGGLPMSIAGDCVSALGMLGGLQKAGRQPDRILWLDAHGDFHTWSTTQTQYIGGMPLAMLVGRSDRRRDVRNDAIRDCLKTIGVHAYPEGRVVLSDARDLDPGEREALAESDVIECRFEDILHTIRPHESLYLHWDTDIVDAEREMPALKYHVKRGPGLADMRALFQSLRHHHIVAVSVSAWHEELDGDNLTARACLDVLEALGR